MKKALIIIIFCLAFAGSAHASEQLDSLFNERCDYLVRAIVEQFRPAEVKNGFLILGVLNDNRFNEKYKESFVKAIKNRIKIENYEISAKAYLLDIPDLDNLLEKYKDYQNYYPELKDRPRYLTIPQLIYGDESLSLGIYIYDSLIDDLRYFDGGYVKYESLKLADEKAWSKLKSTACFEIPDNNIFFKIQTRIDYWDYTNIDSRAFTLPDGRYKIKFKDAYGTGGALDLKLSPRDSLRISLIRKPYKDKTDAIKYLNFLYPGIGLFLLPHPIGGSIDEVGCQYLYLVNTLYLYANLLHVTHKPNIPSNKRFLSIKAKNKYRSKYYQDVAWTCVFYLANIGYGYELISKGVEIGKKVA